MPGCAAGAGDAHEEVTEALSKFFDVWQHAHRRMVRSSADRVHAIRGSVRTCRALNFTVRRFPIAVDTSFILWGLLFGSIGLGFFVYGRRQKTVVPLACGVALMIVPYLVSNTMLLVLLGVALIAIPYFVRM